jgi:hypothetical protein
MDNVIVIQAAIDNLVPIGAGALQINYVKALVAKVVEQQHAHCNSQGRMYSHSTASRAASLAARHAAERIVANVDNPAPDVNNGPPLGQEQQRPGPAYSTNDPCPEHRMVATNAEPIDARTHIAND